MYLQDDQKYPNYECHYISTIAYEYQTNMSIAL